MTEPFLTTGVCGIPTRISCILQPRSSNNPKASPSEGLKDMMTHTLISCIALLAMNSPIGADDARSDGLVGFCPWTRSVHAGKPTSMPVIVTVNNPTQKC